MVAAPAAGRATGNQVVRGEVFVSTGTRAAAEWLVFGWCPVVSGTTSWALGREVGCAPAARSASDLCGRAPATMQGTDRFSFDIDRATWGKPFTLRASQGSSDLEIEFAGARETYVDRQRALFSGLDPERGVVPRGARTARVCLVAGGPTTFTYVARR